jgi:hypothetical protein
VNRATALIASILALAMITLDATSDETLGIATWVGAGLLLGVVLSQAGEALDRRFGVRTLDRLWIAPLLLIILGLLIRSASLCFASFTALVLLRVDLSIRSRRRRTPRPDARSGA